MASENVKSADLRGRTDQELGEFIRDKRAEYLKLRFQKSIGQLENIRKLGSVRREIARALTIQMEKASRQEKKS